ncbi:hydroxyethylthiazole kinase [Pectinatus sottacetonis]|uniref:hydroxyethylthiazole kinase n=1 Tax=Pectinatus sottacetonis TaxID=1002795 RepID=UPI001E2F4CCE|nr:hydroxyethylthiazole kinase [Pectinatus sottacetonis]
MISQENIQKEIIHAVNTVKKENPMVASITNTVTINFVANAQLAVGGSAAMIYLPDEAETLAKAGNAMYINFGTLLPIYEESIPRTAKILYDSHKSWVLDPVGIGAGSLRKKLLKLLKGYRPSIIRGNASEIIALANLWELPSGRTHSGIRGVDSTDKVISARQSAISLAKWTNGTVAVSGETDLITNGREIIFSYGGSHFLKMITGSGCSLGGVAAIYATVTSPFIAALTAVSIYNLAGKRAEKIVHGPGHFQAQFLDELYKATAEDIAANLFTIEEI